MEITHGVTQLRQVAVVLLPGDDQSPAAASLDDLDALISQAVRAIGREADDLRAALALMPGAIDWESLRTFSTEQPEAFELVSMIAAAAYFMSPAVLTSVGYPQGQRKAPRNDQIVDELETGVLDDVMARDSMVREVPA